MLREVAKCCMCVIVPVAMLSCAVRRVSMPLGLKTDRIALALSIKGHASSSDRDDSIPVRASVNGIKVHVFEEYSLVGIDDAPGHTEHSVMRLDHGAQWHRDALTFLRAITTGTYDPRVLNTIATIATLDLYLAEAQCEDSANSANIARDIARELHTQDKLSISGEVARDVTFKGKLLHKEAARVVLKGVMEGSCRPVRERDGQNPG